MSTRETHQWAMGSRYPRDNTVDKDKERKKQKTFWRRINISLRQAWFEMLMTRDTLIICFSEITLQPLLISLMQTCLSWSISSSQWHHVKKNWEEMWSGKRSLGRDDNRLSLASRSSTSLKRISKCRRHEDIWINRPQAEEQDLNEALAWRQIRIATRFQENSELFLFWI